MYVSNTKSSRQKVDNRRLLPWFKRARLSNSSRFKTKFKNKNSRVKTRETEGGQGQRKFTANFFSSNRHLSNRDEREGKNS